MPGRPLLDPLTRLVDALSTALSDYLGIARLEAERLIQPPPRREYGDLSFPLLRFQRDNWDAAAETVRGRLWEAGLRFADVKVVKGFLNVVLDGEALAEEVFRLQAAGWTPHPSPTSEPKRIVVEHTSANPIHPLHVGHARNAALGDTLARLLRARGHTVNVRFYVDDVGRQTAVVALGFRLAGVKPRELAGRMKVKPDRAVGWVYSVTHTAIDAVKLRGAEGGEEKAKLDEALAALARLKEGGPSDVFERILEGVGKMEDPEAEVQEIMRRYEAGLEPEKSLVREVVEDVLDGMKETLDRFGASYEDWDWESMLVWTGRVARVLEEARESPYHMIYKGAEALDIPRIVKELVLPDPVARSSFKLPRGFEIPPLILVRSDGTTLYTTRDIAYSIYKFEAEGADRVINVVGADQRLPQLQVRLALLGLGYKREALNMEHYDYEIVRLPGRRMRSRRGEYIALDALLDEAYVRAELEVRKRNPGAAEDWVRRTAEAVAIGALRFALIQPGRLKPITLFMDKILDFKENSGPYLQYTHARANSILEKHGQIDYLKARPAALAEGERRDLMVEALRFPLVAAKAADDLAPEDLASYLLRLADRFNSWYQKDSVIHEVDEGAKHAKAALVKLVRDTIAAGLTLLGVEPLARM